MHQRTPGDDHWPRRAWYVGAPGLETMAACMFTGRYVCVARHAGRLLDALGAPIDDLGDLEQPQQVRCTPQAADAHPRHVAVTSRVVAGPCAHLPQKLVRATLKHDLPPVLSRAPAERFLPSGLKAVDAFFPIARGSNVAVVGGRYVHGTLRFRGVCPIPHRCVWLCVNASGAWARVRWRWTCSSPSTA